MGESLNLTNSQKILDGIIIVDEDYGLPFTADEWRDLEFNGLPITLVFAGINKLNLQGERVGFIC
ncbi:hypothetical protein JHU04_004318 [Brenneria sp. 4F2]|nr:hypothetical protein [Brenneria bubanii]